VIKKRIKKFRKVKDLVPTSAGQRMAGKAAELNPMAPLPQQPQPSLEDVPQITNETIAEHREEVLRGARKYIYPLHLSKRRIIVISSVILASAIAAFLIYCTVGLYRFYQHNTFLYRVTQVVPFPVARIGNTFVAYENYLFELRHYIHYYQEQGNLDDEGTDFSRPGYKEQLAEYQKQALANVIDLAYIKILADENNISVSNKEVDERIADVREQNRLGADDDVLADVLSSYWGWSISDFKRSLKDQILIEKVTGQLDSEAMAKANSALTKVKGGADFAAVAKEVSEDPTSKAEGGEYSFLITRNNPNIPPQVIGSLFKLKPGQVSGIINTGSTLEIVKVEKVEGDSVTARHIVFTLKDPAVFIEQLKKEKPAKTYINL
jgi:hypothetical protein